MRPLSIRARLMAWYALFLAMSLILFAVLAALMMRQSIYDTVDEELEHQARTVVNLMVKTSAGGGANDNQGAVAT